MATTKGETTTANFLPPRKVMIRELQIPGKRNYWRTKRSADFFVALAFLIVLSPLMLLISLLIVIDDPKGGPIYSQVRCGRGGKMFRMLKFRSMKVGADKMLDELLKDNEMTGPAFKMKNDPRVTRVGRLLRSTSLDELPQLINILRGEMTIVGPRPPLPREVDLYDEYQFQRLYVTPGLTCLWQIAPNRNDISFDKWLEMDIDYIINRTLWLDIQIVFKTAIAVLRRDGR